LQLVSESTPPEVIEVWEQAVAAVRERFPATFSQWFSSVQFDGLISGVLYLAARDEFVRDWVKDHFQTELTEALESALGSRLKVQWEVRSELTNPVGAAGSDDLTQSGVRRPRRLRMGESKLLEGSAVSTDGRVDSFVAGISTSGLGHSTSAGRDAAASRASASDGPASGGFTGASGLSSNGPVGNSSERNSYIAHRARREQLNTKYTFNNFVVGPSNELAHAAAIAAAGGGGPRYNPLFICGGTGLGKTHLMHSIAHYVLDKRRDACVLYVSAERFTNQFIEALQHHKMEEFRYRYRAECDVLLVDDIQFLAGREQTQEEFFHTFNALHEADKPIVVSSDKYPQDLQRMPERLISRFASGLVADIQTPALETRVAIVRKKAHLEGITLDHDVAVFLAQHVRSNVRELEGTLIRLAAKSSLVGRPIDLAFAESEIAAASPARPDVRSVEDIQRAVCGHFRLTNADLLSKDRHKSVAFARQVAMYLCRQRLKCSFPELGRAFGNRDHTTVMSAVRRVEALRAKDPQVKAHLEAIENRLAKSEE
jgi:chromosomal replication initiator protein